jgi:hypothetical protein
MQRAFSIARFHRHARRIINYLSFRRRVYERLEDRRILTSVIFPALRDESTVRRILFVGCEWYTKSYEEVFCEKEYWTLEIDADKRRYGAKHHIVDALRNLDRHVNPEFFDAIICNGVFMKTAIETREEAESSFESCYRCLRSNGWFVLGWNDVDHLRPYNPIESHALGKFRRTEFPVLHTSEYITDTTYRHVYTFFAKP